MNNPSIGSYLLAEVLGKGSFCKVYRGVHQTTNKEFAVKCIKKEFLR